MLGRLARLAAGAAIAVLVAACGGDAPRTSPTAAVAAATVHVQIGGRPLTPPLRGGFVGLSLEVSALPAYAGQDPGAVNPVFEQLIRNLAPGQEPVLRIGGDSTDVSWIPVRGLRRSRGTTYAITGRWLGAARALAQALGARLILGVDLEAGRPGLAAAEARAFVASIGRRYVRALEIGNEANRYSTLAWYRTAHRHPVYARRRGYGYADFAADFARTAREMPRGIALAGPTVGGFGWLSHLGSFLAEEPAVRVATFHRYPLDRCFTPRNSSDYPTIGHLLSPRSSAGLVAGLSRYVDLAHRRGVAFRLDEFNSVACGGKFGISDTFAAALWALDTTFDMARTGVDGVNVHTFPGAGYQLFSFRHAGGQWTASVRPEYYGLMMFARAAPPGSRLLAVSVTGAPGVRVWATRGSAGRVRVVLINESSAGRVATVALPAGWQRASAELERLTAPGAAATGGVTLGGSSFGPSTSSGRLPDHPTPLPPANRALTVALPATSAALLTITER